MDVKNARGMIIIVDRHGAVGEIYWKIHCDGKMKGETACKRDKYESDDSKG